ncbi:MAG: hypothetical protein FJ404_05255 [Verrucomicrobia bacterium]|nr:hypothetical protein [Verrucomicrobiota bacterium]
MTPSQRQQFLAVGAIAVVALFAADKLVLSPLAATWKKRTEEIDGLRKSIANGSMLIEREQETNRRWNEMRKNTLPANVSQAEQELLKSLYQWSDETSVGISLHPQWKRGASEDYSSLECRIDAAGSLSSLTKFIHEVERSPMALRIESLELTSRDPEGSQIALALVVSGLRLAPLERKP